MLALEIDRVGFAECLGHVPSKKNPISDLQALMKPMAEPQENPVVAHEKRLLVAG